MVPIIRKFYKNSFYHVYSRGVEKRQIFLDDQDYIRFYKSVFFFNSNSRKTFNETRPFSFKEKEIVKILSFKLMPNHFHMKIQEIEKGGISKYMQKLITSYTMYFNKKYSRFGSLFGTRFRDKLIKEDRYFKYLDFYIKFNCIKIIKPEYDIYKIFSGETMLTKEELNFVEKYPYYFEAKGSTYNRP